MSKGPGRIERGLSGLMAAHPDRAFTLDQLCRDLFPGAEIEKKHRVSVARALAKRVAGDPDWRIWRSERPGRQLVLLNHADVTSYAMARVMVERLARLDPEEPAQVLAKLAEPRNCELIDAASRGSWWLHVQQHIAERDGDKTLAAKLKAENLDKLARALKRFRGRTEDNHENARKPEAGRFEPAVNVSKMITGTGKETLTPAAPAVEPPTRRGFDIAALEAMERPRAERIKTPEKAPARPGRPRKSRGFWIEEMKKGSTP